MKLSLIAATLVSTLGALATAAQDAPPAAGGLFETSDQCIACHSGISGPSGEDVSIGYRWRASMMANSARDPYWQAAVRREIMDHPQAQSIIENECSTCHMPMTHVAAASSNARTEIFSSLGDPFSMDGVSCTVCHQIRADNFGTAESFTGGFLIDRARPPGERLVYGPYAVDPGRQRLMHSAVALLPSESSHLAASELCATCHTLHTHALGPGGEDLGRLAEQVPYQEWLHSTYRETQSCQSCHMPVLGTDIPVSSVLGTPRPGFSQHTFHGANAFMLRILNRYRGELGVVALSQELDAAARETVEFLGKRSAALDVSAAITGEMLTLDVAIESLTGHKLPTAYPSRRAWLHVAVRDAGGDLVFESGAVRPDGSIAGNDNDAAALEYEPHYEIITAAEQVQIYESIMVDQASAVTTGLLSGVRYVKDNRLLPSGFDKATASDDIAVIGAARSDADFTGGGDRVRYRIETGPAEGPLTVTVELLYQSIAYRWAANLEAYDAAETRRFRRYYAENAEHSALLLAARTIEVDRR
jgi:hypothetical protein